jgi:tellurite resistance protein TerC
MAWIALLLTLAALLAVDLLIVRGRHGHMTVKAASVWSVAWVAISLAFAGVLLVAGHDGQAQGFLAGYLVEKSLSLDNVFVFLIVFQAFAVAENDRARLLTYGIVGALVLRAVFIFAGATALEHASWLSIPFAALLAWTGWRLWKGRHEHQRAERSPVGDRASTAPRLYSEEQLVERVRQRLPQLSVGAAALMTIAVVDVIFAVDSVPAILAITTDTFVVFAANAFALLGLRPLFFLVADLVERLYYLKAALAVLLGFIAAKMVTGELVGKLGPEVSLAGVAVILGGGVVASLVRDRRASGATSGPASARSSGGG